MNADEAIHQQPGSLTLAENLQAELWEKTMAAIQSYGRAVCALPVSLKFDPRTLRALVRGIDFQRPMDPFEAIEFSLDGLLTYQTHTNHPCYFGLFDPAPATMSMVAELLVAAFNPQLSVWTHSPFAVEVEQHLLNEFGHKFGYPPGGADGTFTSGGAEANHTALITALVSVFPEFAQHGLRGLSRTPVFYVSAEAHHSLVKAARFCGLGVESVRFIPVDEALRMDVTALARQIGDDRSANLEPFMVVATAGTTSSGAVDPIAEIAEIAQRERLWLHTDAAWGGGIALVPELRSLLNGMELSDSITFDPHKLLSINKGAGMYLTRHKEVLGRAAGVAPAYMPKPPDAGFEVVDPFVHSLQWTRRFIGLKLFLSLMVMGWEGYAIAIRSQMSLATYLGKRVEESGWKVINDTSLGVVCFVDPANEHLGVDYLEAVAQEVRASGRTWLSTTRVGQGRAVLRACVANHRSRKADVHVLISELDMARRKARACLSR